MDEIYIRKILEGNSEEFRYIIDKYKDMAYSIAMSVVKDEFLAEEIIQTSFVKAFEGLDSFKGNSKFSTWFYRIVINESFKIAKKHRNELLTFVEEYSVIPVELEKSILELEEDDQKYFINEALKKLTSKESLILRLFYLEENSIDEISNLTGWSESNIKVILHRARTNLRLVLSDIYKLSKKELL
jgi:RNA polymerase sigma-70 factor (ECF subfamily)